MKVMKGAAMHAPRRGPRRGWRRRVVVRAVTRSGVSSRRVGDGLVASRCRVDGEMEASRSRSVSLSSCGFVRRTSGWRELGRESRVCRSGGRAPGGLGRRGRVRRVRVAGTRARVRGACLQPYGSGEGVAHLHLLPARGSRCRCGAARAARVAHWESHAPAGRRQGGALRGDAPRGGTAAGRRAGPGGAAARIVDHAAKVPAVFFCMYKD